MKICPKCRALSEQWPCIRCGYQADRKNGFIAFAPELERKQEGFRQVFYEDYAHLESSHFWFRARGLLITWALKKYGSCMRSFLEVGCGTGYVLSQIAAVFPAARLIGSEMFSAGLKFASSRLPRAELVQMDARDIPYIDEFEAIGAFDVIEHIEADTVVLQQMCRSLKSGGIMLLTVPQHQWLWSKVDEYACHVRRYNAVDLHRKVEEAGFSVLRSTSFVSFLLPAMAVSRLFGSKQNDSNKTAELAVSRVLNLLFGFVMWLERICIKAGINFPVGASRLLIAKKKA